MSDASVAQVIKATAQSARMEAVLLAGKRRPRQILPPGTKVHFGVMPVHQSFKIT